MMRILGIDPGLRCTGWGVIVVDGGRLQHIANGAIQPKSTIDDASRLQIIFDGLCEVITPVSYTHLTLPTILLV